MARGFFQITDIDLAVRMYYERIELSSADIMKLFGVKSSQTVAKLKKTARELMLERGRKSWNPYNVNTVIAYEAWGLDISDLEKRRTKLARLKASLGG